MIIEISIDIETFFHWLLYTFCMDRSETGSFVQVEKDIAIWHDKHSELSKV